MGIKVAVISDIHSNLFALKAVLQSLAGIDAVWCLGDVVGYAAQPAECIDVLMTSSRPLVKVAGNHDLGTADKISLADFVPEGQAAITWTRPRLSASQLQFLEDQTMKSMHDNVTLVHGSPRDPVWEYISSVTTAGRCMADLPTDICFYGHTHIPMVYRRQADGSVDGRAPQNADALALETKNKWLINPGSVGQPRDRDPRASFLIFNTDEFSVEFRRVDYPVDQAQKAILQAGLPTVLAARLEYGL